MFSHLEVQTAVSKINKYASSESGDTVELIERPRGGLSIVMADGQRSGRSAKAISNIVVRKAITLLAEGVRDGAVARATHDYLQVHRGGKVSAELNIVSIDLVTRTIVISRNSRCPVLLRRGAEIFLLDALSDAVGVYHNTKPHITELPLEPNMTVVVFTDGIWGAGSPSHERIDLPQLLQAADDDHARSPIDLADMILAEALRLERGRPRDDATVLVVKIIAQIKPDNVRRLFMQFPI